MSPCQAQTRSGKCYNQAAPPRRGTAKTKRAKSPKAKPAKAKPAKATCYNPIMTGDESEAHLFLELDGGEGNRQTICINKDYWESYRKAATMMYRCKPSTRRKGSWLPEHSSKLYKVALIEGILLSKETMARITKAVEAGSKGRAPQASLVLERINKLVRASNADVNDKHQNSQGAAMCGITGQFHEYA